MELPSVLCCSPSVAPGLDQAQAEQMATILKAMADPVRLRLISVIAQSGEVCACDLPAMLERSQPTISHHLKVLAEAGLINREQRGKWAWFRVQADTFEAVARALMVNDEAVGSTN